MISQHISSLRWIFCRETEISDIVKGKEDGFKKEVTKVHFLYFDTTKPQWTLFIAWYLHSKKLYILLLGIFDLKHALSVIHVCKKLMV